MEKLSSVANAHSAALLLHSPAHQQHAISMHSGYDQSTIRSYTEYFGTRDIWMQKAHPIAYSGWPGLSEQICPSAELFKSEIYNDLLRQIDIAHAMWAAVDDPRTGPTNNVIGTYRGRAQGAFEPSDLELLRFLTPHMKRASYLHFKISALRQMGGDLQTALDQLSSGVILVGHDRKILAMNVHARRLVTQSDGLSVIHERLTASSPSESEKLQNLLKQSQATSESRGLNPGSGLTVTRRDGSKLMVLVSPISMRSLSPQIDGARTVVFIHDPSRKHRPSIQILQSLFALTPAECRVASLLAQGFSPPEIAALVGVSRNTLKTQLASMYRKTGTSRQGQLLKLLLQVCLR